MAKFDIKGIMKSGMESGKVLIPVTAGIIAAQKFLDAKTLLPNQDPNKWFMKHEGAIKFGGVIITLAIWKKCPPLVKYLLWGLAIQGAIKEARTLTMNDQGVAAFTQIGSMGEYDAAIQKMAEEIKNAAAGNMSGTSDITANNYSSVAGNNNQGVPA